MVGRAVSLTLDKAPARTGEATFKVRHLTVVDHNGQHVVDDMSFDIAKGEVLAIAGVQGNGQTELTEAILGVQPHVSGIHHPRRQGTAGPQRQARPRRRRRVRARGPHVDGLVGTFSISENLILDLYDQAPFARGIGMKPAVIAGNAAEKGRRVRRAHPSVSAAVGTLSGGNQQKVVLARELSRPLRLFIASQPTRGLDVGSIEFVHKRVIAERDHGTPVMIVSTELDEVMNWPTGSPSCTGDGWWASFPADHVPRRAGPDDGRSPGRRGRSQRCGPRPQRPDGGRRARSLPATKEKHMSEKTTPEPAAQAGKHARYPTEPRDAPGPLRAEAVTSDVALRHRRTGRSPPSAVPAATQRRDPDSGGPCCARSSPATRWFPCSPCCSPSCSAAS